MAHNTYVRDGWVQRTDDGVYRGRFLYGTRVYDPAALRRDGFHFVPYSQLGKPHEIVLHIAGVTYYPTRNGYVQV